MFKTINQRISLVLFFIAIVYLILTYQLPSYAYTEVDADMIPTALGWILIFLSILLFFSKDSETEAQKARRNIPKKDIAVLLTVGAFIFVYIMLLEILGFIIITALFIYFCSWFLGYQKHFTNIAVSILFPLFMYIVFTMLLNISLPKGLLPF
jgi:putative tricarboxylic transport membrane protein